MPGKRRSAKEEVRSPRMASLRALGLEEEPAGLTEALARAALVRPIPRKLWVSDSGGRGSVRGLGLAVPAALVGPRGKPVPGSAAYYVAARLGRSGPVKQVFVGRADLMGLPAARAHARELLNRLARGEDPTAQKQAAKAEELRRVTVEKFIEGDYAERHLKNRRSGDAEKARLMTVWKPLHGLRLDEVTEDCINDVLQKRRNDGIAHNTLLRDWTGIRALLGKAVKFGALTALPFQGRPSALEGLMPNRRIRFLGQHAEDESSRFLAALREESSEVQAAFALLAISGMRRGELLGLNKSELRLADGVAVIPAARSKSSRERIVRLNAQAVAILEAMKPDKTGAYFPGSVATWVTRLKRAMARIRIAAKLSDFRIHDLRHSFAVQARRAGAPLESIRDLLGHADIRMAERYSHIAEGELRQLVAKIGL
jgi:integrase